MTDNPFAAPEHGVHLYPSANEMTLELDYVGFWYRVLAHIIDKIIFSILLVPIGFLMRHMTDATSASSVNRGELIFANITIPSVEFALTCAFVLVFWHLKSATPGKMIFKMKIVDAKTYGKPTFGQYLIRYIGYLPSMLVLGLGFLWAAWDNRKQGWHDKMAGTLVVRPAVTIPAKLI